MRNTYDMTYVLLYKAKTRLLINIYLKMAKEQSTEIGGTLVPSAHNFDGNKLLS